MLVGISKNGARERLGNPQNSLQQSKPNMKPLSSATLPACPSGLAIFVSPLTILPDLAEPHPATIIVDQTTGKVLEVIAGELLRDERSLDLQRYGGLEVNEIVEIPEGRVLLPGLVE